MVWGKQLYWRRGIHDCYWNTRMIMTASPMKWLTQINIWTFLAHSSTVDSSDGYIVGCVVGDGYLCWGGLHGDWWSGERCWGDDEDIPDRHTTSRWRSLPVQSDNRRAELVLNEGYAWIEWTCWHNWKFKIYDYSVNRLRLWSINTHQQPWWFAAVT